MGTAHLRQEFLFSGRRRCRRVSDTSEMRPEEAGRVKAPRGRLVNLPERSSPAHGKAEEAVSHGVSTNDSSELPDRVSSHLLQSGGLVERGRDSKREERTPPSAEESTSASRLGLVCGNCTHKRTPCS